MEKTKEFSRNPLQVLSDFIEFQRLSPELQKELEAFKVSYHNFAGLHGAKQFINEFSFRFSRPAKQPDGRALTSAENGKLGGRPPKQEKPN